MPATDFPWAACRTRFPPIAPPTSAPGMHAGCWASGRWYCRGRRRPGAGQRDPGRRVRRLPPFRAPTGAPWLGYAGRREELRPAVSQPGEGPGRAGHDLPRPPARDPDRTAAEVWAAVASGLGGRMFEALRDRRSLAYTVLASVGSGDGPAPWSPISLPRPTARRKPARRCWRSWSGLPRPGKRGRTEPGGELPGRPGGGQPPERCCPGRRDAGGMAHRQWPGRSG